MHTVQTIDQTVYLGDICPPISHCVDTCMNSNHGQWTYHVSWLHSFNSLRMHLSKNCYYLIYSVGLIILNFVKIEKEICVLLNLRMQAIVHSKTTK